MCTPSTSKKKKKMLREIKDLNGSEKCKSLSCPILCNPMDWGLPGSSVHGILQARMLEQVAIPFSRGSSQTRDWTQVSCAAGRWATWKAQRPKEKERSTIFIYLRLKIDEMLILPKLTIDSMPSHWKFQQYTFRNQQAYSKTYLKIQRI